jgi:hypothetical protein
VAPADAVLAEEGRAALRLQQARYGRDGELGRRVRDPGGQAPDGGKTGREALRALREQLGSSQGGK